MSKPMSVFVSAVVAGALVAATAVSADAAPVPARRSTVLRVTSAKTVAAPKATQPGIAHLRNTGKRNIFVLQQKKAGAATLLKDLNAQAKSDSPGRLIKDFTLLTLLAPKSDVYVPLSRGTVFLGDADVSHYKAKMITSVNVVGPHANAMLPASADLTVSRDNLLHADKTIPASGYLHLRNRSAQLQEVLLLVVGTKVTTATLKNFIAHPSFGNIEQISPHFRFAFLSIVAGGTSEWSRQTATAGRVVAINIPFRPSTTEPKLHKGQARVITVG